MCILYTVYMFVYIYYIYIYTSVDLSLKATFVSRIRKQGEQMQHSPSDEQVSTFKWHRSKNRQWVVRKDSEENR